MDTWLATPLLTALGFFLGFFYTRTMRLAERLPKDYSSRDDCRTFRLECHRGLEQDRAELLERIGRIESKLDRIIESLIQAGAGRA